MITATQLFRRIDHYTQTDIVGRYKITVKQWKELALEKNLDHIRRTINHGTYTTEAYYYRIEDIQALGLQMR